MGLRGEACRLGLGVSGAEGESQHNQSNQQGSMGSINGEGECWEGQKITTRSTITIICPSHTARTGGNKCPNNGLGGVHPGRHVGRLGHSPRAGGKWAWVTVNWAGKWGLEGVTGKYTRPQVGVVVGMYKASSLGKGVLEEQMGIAINCNQLGGNVRCHNNNPGGVNVWAVNVCLLGGVFLNKRGVVAGGMGHRPSPGNHLDCGNGEACKGLGVNTKWGSNPLSCLSTSKVGIKLNGFCNQG